MSTTGLQNLAIGYIAVWAISPPLFASDTARLLVVLATAIWLAMESLRPAGLFRCVTLPVLLTLVFIGYTGLLNAMLYGAAGLIREIQIWIMLFFLVVWQSRRHDLQSLVPVFWLVLAVQPVWLFFTVQTITTVNDRAARILVRSSAEAMELAQQGVGGYALVYGFLLLVPALIGLARNRHRLRGEALAWPLRLVPRFAFGLVILNIGLGVTLVLTAGFSIAVIALTGILLSVIFLTTFSARRLLMIAFATVIFGFLARPILETTLTALLPVAEGTNFAHKIRDVLASLQLGDAVGAAEDRLERYLRSIRLFAESPLIGVLAFDDVGKHSAILDNFARWGVLFGSLFVYLVSFHVFRMLRRNKREFGVGVAMLAAVTVIFGLNSAFAAAGLMLYIMFPVSLHIVRAQAVQQGPRGTVALHA